MKKNIDIEYSKLFSSAVKSSIFPNGLKSLIPGYDLYKLMEPLAEKVVKSANLTSQNDVENIKELIRAGKEQGLEEMNIKVAKSVGVDVGGDLSPIDIPVNCKFKIGADGEMTINVKYR